jgi:hypothetical protein
MSRNVPLFARTMLLPREQLTSRRGMKQLLAPITPETETPHFNADRRPPGTLRVVDVLRYINDSR